MDESDEIQKCEHEGDNAPIDGCPCTCPKCMNDDDDCICESCDH